MKVSRKFTAGFAVLGAVFATYSCSKDHEPAPVNKAPKVQVTQNSKFGNILTDSAGRTLYFFSNDANGNSSCTGGCLVAWPVFYNANLTLPGSLTASDFGTITRNDGSKQTTFKGWPLYYYQSDAHPYDVTGDGVGNIWFVAKPDYSVMLANTQLIGSDNNPYTFPNNVTTAGSGATSFITDDRGRTLYLYSNDKFKKNNFTKSDFSNNAVWPCDTIKAIANVPSILDKTQFDTVIVFGKVQLSYKGWPMYYFGQDSATRGKTKGISFPRINVWQVMNGTTATAAH